MSLAWKCGDCSRIRARHLAQRQAVARRVEALDPPGDLHRLERHPAHAGLPEREVDDRAELVVVEPLLERDDQRRRDPVLVEALERPVADVDQVGAAHRLLGRGVERVELEVHLEARHVPGEPAGELGVIGDPHAVGVDHQVLDRPLAGQVEHGEELGVDRRLAAGDLHDVRPPLVPHDAIQHERDLLQRPVQRPPRRALGVADRAGQVAVVGDLD